MMYTMVMVIALHVTIAIMSLTIATIGFLFPSKLKLRLSYGFIAATVVSGTYLIVTLPAHMLQSCMMGLAYLAIVSVATVATHRKLVRLTQTSNR